MGLIDGDPEGPFQVKADGSGAEAPDTAQPVKAVKLEEIVDHMIRPDHESWVRDEDEAFCKTPRGSAYQG
jgi:hypothetical protein